MKDWFANLQPRERAIFIGGAAVVLLIVLWAGVLRPLQSRSAVLRETVAAKQRLLVDLARIDGQGPSPGVNGPGAGQGLIALINSTALQHNVKLTRTQPNGPDGMQVTFGNASFDTLVEWLVALETQYTVSVESASFTGTREPGLVNGQLLLRRP